MPKLNRTYHLTLFPILIIVLCTSCARYIPIQDYVPTVNYRNFQIKKFEPDIDLLKASFKADLSVEIKFRFNNPYNFDLIIPDHQFKFKMRDWEITQLTKNKASFKVPPKSHIDQVYTLKLDLDPQGYLKDFMGKENPFAFEGLFFIKLSDYVKDDLGKKIVKSLGNKENYEIPFKYEDTLKLPLPPQISPTLSEFSYVDFLGSNNTIDLRPMNDFVDFLLNATIKVYSPTRTEWFRMIDVKAADYLVSRLSIIDNTAPEKWRDFKNKWNAIKDNGLKIEYPGPNTTGYKLYVPLTIYNPNEFPIESSFLTATASYNSSYDPYIMEIKPSDANKMIPGKTRKTIYLTWQTNFFNGNILDLFTSGKLLPHNPALHGKFGIDVGYGMMEIPYNITIPFKFGN